MCIADDSGIEIESLDGFPGVLTKRWHKGTDRERNLAIIEKLKGIPKDVVKGIPCSLNLLIKLVESPLSVRTTKHLSSDIDFVYKAFNKHSVSLFFP